MMKISDKLFNRLKNHPELIDRIRGDGYCMRSYAGCGMKSAGAWIWSVEHDGIAPIGSCWTMKECLQAETLTIDLHGTFGIEIIPTEDLHPDHINPKNLD